MDHGPPPRRRAGEVAMAASEERRHRAVIVRHRRFRRSRSRRFVVFYRKVEPYHIIYMRLPKFFIGTARARAQPGGRRFVVDYPQSVPR